MAKRRTLADQFKARVALEGPLGDKTIREIAARHQVRPNQINTRKHQVVEGMSGIIARGGKSEGPTEAKVKDWHAAMSLL